MDNTTPSRRSFLKYIGVGAGVSAIGVSGIVATQNRQTPAAAAPANAAGSAADVQPLPADQTVLDSQLGELSRMAQAIASGTLRITFIGDSILEGVSQITFQDSPAGLWMRMLQEQNPALDIVFSNYSIPGLSPYQLRHPDFVGAAANVTGVSFAMAESSPAERRWPGGTVIGKSWWDHVKDSKPDLLIFGFGMNDVVQGEWAYNPTTVSNAAFYRELNGRMAQWPSPPSVAAITSMLPTHRSDLDGGAWPRFRVMVQQDADMVRGICREFNWTCIDANRWWSLAADAKDPVLMQHEHFLALKDHAASWTVQSGSWTANAEDSLQGTGTLRSKEMCNDLYQRMSFTVADLGSTPGMFWRDRGDMAQGKPNRYSASVVKGSWGKAQLQVSWQDQSLALLPLGDEKQSYALEVLVEGARHRIYVDNVLLADLSHMGNMGEGYNGVFISGGKGTLSGSTVRQGRPTVVGEVKYSDDDLLGINDWLTNPKSLGGGARNHPSRLGVRLAYVPAFAPLGKAINQLAAFGSGVVSRMLKDDSSDFWSGLSSCSLVIDEQAQEKASPMVSGAALMLATGASVTVRVDAARAVPVYLRWNESRKDLATTLPLGVGRWTVTAMAQLSRVGDKHLQTLTVTAVRA